MYNERLIYSLSCQMKKVLLHIGSGKTGSSSIQTTLSRNGPELKRLGISYPKFGHPTNHEELNIPFKGDSGPRSIGERFKRQRENFESYRKRLLKEFLNHINKNRYSIISAEHLHTLNNQRIIYLKQQLELCGVERVKIIIYLREPVSLYKSQLQQKLKASSQTVTPERWKYQFSTVINRWFENFEDVEVREFSSKELYNNDVVDDFLHIGSQFFELPKLFDIKRTKFINESYSLEEMYLLQQFRKILFSDKEDIFMPLSGLLMRNFHNIDYRSELTKPILKDEVAKIIRYKVSHEVDELRKVLGKRIFNDFESLQVKPNYNFENTSSVLDLFKTDKDVKYETLKLAIKILERNLD